MAGGYQGGYNPQPVRPARSGSGAVAWIAAGCGVLVLIVMVLGAIGVYSISKNKMFAGTFNGIRDATACGPQLAVVRDAIEKYRGSHNGNYPPDLKALTPDYVADASSLRCSGGESYVDFEYTRPGPKSSEDTVVVSAFMGSNRMMGKASEILYYARLLKDGSVVMDQVTRSTTVVKRKSSDDE